MKRNKCLWVLGLAIVSQSCVIVRTAEPALRVSAPPVLEARAESNDRPPPRRAPRPQLAELGGY